MPAVFCSKKLSALLGISAKPLPVSPEAGWNAHLFFIQGRKCLVFVHKETLYSFVVFDFRKGQARDLAGLFSSAFFQQLQADGLIRPEDVPVLAPFFGSAAWFTTDGDRSTIGYLNDCVSRLTFPWDEKPPVLDRVKHYVATRYNQNLLLQHQGTTPQKRMQAKLSGMLGREG